MVPLHTLLLLAALPLSPLDRMAEALVGARVARTIQRRPPTSTSPSLIPPKPRTTCRTALRSSSDKNQNLSSSSQARRDEDRRRRERKDDVVIGKTSALPDATDYKINPDVTERQWKSQAGDVEREVFEQTELGMECLKMLRVEEASDAFDRVYTLKPNAYLWQSGLAKFYLNDLSGAADRFAHNAILYESKFGGPASEERIWRDACELKAWSLMGRKERDQWKTDGKREPILAQIRERGGMAETMTPETRKVVRIARDLFSASIADDYSTVVLSRAKLRSICGEYGSPARIDRKMWKLSSWYYLGLHYDAIGEPAESKACMKMALRMCPSAGNGGDIIHTLPVLHMARRDWYDDEEFVEEGARDGETSIIASSSEGGGGADAATSPVVIQSIRDSVGKLRLAQLQDALRTRGLKSSGSKDVLRERLFNSLLDDAGLQ